MKRKRKAFVKVLEKLSWFLLISGLDLILACRSYSQIRVSGLGRDTQCAFGSSLKSELVLLFRLFLLLFIGLTTLIDTIHRFHYTISVNCYFYLQYFQQKVFNFSKISKSQTDPQCADEFFSFE